MRIATLCLLVHSEIYLSQHENESQSIVSNDLDDQIRSWSRIFKFYKYVKV
jgi:hypothetical protein